MQIFELVGNLVLTGMSKVEGELSKLEKNVARVQKGMKVAGAAFTGLGVAGLAIVSSTKEINAKLGVTALNLGLTTKEMRDLALETTNVTFPIDQVTETFDLLARAGVEDQQVLKDVATAFDTLGDAIGMPASQVTENMIPAMKTFGLTADDMAAQIDKMTYLTQKTTLSLDDYNTMVGYTTPELVDMGLEMDDLTAILIHMEKQGFAPGRVMTREFQKAVTLATKEQIPLTEAIGMTAEELEGYKKELDGSTGMAKEFGDEANKQFTIMHKVKQKFDELTLSASGFLEPLEPVLAGMTAMGPLMIGLSTSAGTAAIKWGLHTTAMVAHKVALLASAVAIKVVTAAQWLWNIAMSANPIGLIILGIAALIAIGVLLWKNWDKVTEFFEDAWNRMKAVMNTAKKFFIDIWEKITGIFKKHWDLILAILFPAVGIPILIARNWDQIVDVVMGIWERVIKVFSGIWETAKEWGMDLVKGLWEGIQSLATWIWDKVAGFAKGIWENIKAGLGNLWPFSPSEAGVDIGEGLAEGIQLGVKKAIGNVRSAMQDMTAEMSISPGATRPATAPSAIGTSPLTNMFHFHIAQLVVREEADVKKIAREFYLMQQEKLAQAGL